MTFREKLLWVSMIAHAAIWGSYLFDIGWSLAHGRVIAAQAYGGFVKSTILLAGVQILATIVLSVIAPQDADAPMDIRDREIAARAAVPAYNLLSVVVIVTMLATPAAVRFAPQFLTGDPATAIAVVIGNALLSAVVAAHVVHCAVQLHRYRAGSIA